MLAVIYLILCMTTGFVIISFAAPKLSELTETTFRGKPLKLCKAFLLLPAWFVSGTLAVTWTTYIAAYLFRAQEQPLRYGNAVSMGVFFIVSAVGIVILIRKKRPWVLKGQFDRLEISEMIFIALVIALTYQLMWTTFFVSDGQLYVGLSVFSDFAPHLGMIRSFSHGNNFPTVYSHYAGEDIRYHFMFQFLAGNLEFLGMRLDWAFNLPSALSFLGVFFLLYVLAVRLSDRRSVGFLSGLFFAFRCSPSIWSFLAEVPKGTNILAALSENIEFISYTPKENWGLWNLNVYCNQRHLAFGMCALLLILNIFIPRIYDMAARWKDLTTEQPPEQPPVTDVPWYRRAGYQTAEFFRMSFLTKEGWIPENWLRPVAAGILLGMTAFWNGATLLATIMVLFVLAIISDRRLEFLITAVITTALSMLQTSFFIDGEMLETKLQFGFIADNPTLFGTIQYIMLLCGILPLVLFAAFVIVKGVRKYILLAFSAPFFFSFCVSLTMDVTVNHKYIMISLMLMNIFAAILIVRLFENKNIWLKGLCVFIVILMTATGIYDFTVVLKRNQPSNNLVYSMDDELFDWVEENTTSQDIFLTPNYSLNRVVLSGAMLFEGWPYYPMTAGYDTYKRAALVKLMYEAQSSEELIELIEENSIDYVIIDIAARQSSDYAVNEAVFDATYEKVYTENSGEWMLSIYDTSKKLVQ